MPDENTPVSLPSFPLVLASESTTDFPIVPVKHHRERISRERVAAIDLRIGLHMLGEQGRKLLAEYIAIKRQGRGNNL